MCKTVLMIANTFYPSNGSGAHRPAKTAKYLPYFGWQALVVCKETTSKDFMGRYDPNLAAKEDVCKVIRVKRLADNLPAERLEKIFWTIFGGAGLDYRFPYLLFQKMQGAAEKTINSFHVDAIWATSPSGLNFKIAHNLSRKYNIPWVADFRDLPDQTYINRCTRYVVKQEVKTCLTAKSLITTTKELAEKLKKRHALPVHLIFNGFDPQDFDSRPSPEEFGKKFTINHFGTLYSYRNPSCLFEAIDLLFRDSEIELSDIEVSFYGAKPAAVHNWSQSYECQSCIKAPGRLSHSDMIKRQMSSQILLLVASPGQGGAIPAKLYDYLASKRPILCIPGDGSGTDRILKQSKAGVSLSDPKKIAIWLKKNYDFWKVNMKVDYSGEQSQIQQYSRKLQAGQVAEILHKAISGSQ